MLCTTVLMYNKDDLGTYIPYTTETQELLTVLQLYMPDVYASATRQLAQKCVEWLL